MAEGAEDIKKDPEVDIVKLKADYETAIADLAKANEKIGSLESEKAQLNAYIAKYVSSNTPSNNGGVVDKKSFMDMYAETLAEMKIKEMESKKD